MKQKSYTGRPAKATSLAVIIILLILVFGVVFLRMPKHLSFTARAEQEVGVSSGLMPLVRTSSRIDATGKPQILVGVKNNGPLPYALTLKRVTLSGSTIQVTVDYNVTDTTGSRSYTETLVHLNQGLSRGTYLVKVVFVESKGNTTGEKLRPPLTATDILTVK